MFMDEEALLFSAVLSLINNFSIYFAIRSVSIFTESPTFFFNNVVEVAVSGMILTSKYPF